LQAPGIVLWGVLLIAAIALYWLPPAWTTVTVFATVATVIACGSAALSRQRARLRKLAIERKGESICHFARSFNTRLVDPGVIRVVYDVLQHELESVHPAFPVRASDTLQRLISDPDDLDMGVAPEVARRARRSLENTQANPYFGKVHSVFDLVMFFNVQERAREAGLPIVRSASTA
jgi:hypothetical protein